MKKISTCALIVALAVATRLEAASLRVECRPAASGDSLVYSIYMDGLTAAEQVTAMEVTLLPGTGTSENYSETGFGPGPDFKQLGVEDDFTFTNAALTLPAFPPFFGQGWNIIDGSTGVTPPSGPDGIGYAASDPGNFLEADDLLLNNIMLPKSGSDALLRVVFIGADGNPMPEPFVQAQICIPEPTSMALAGLVTFALVATRKRK